MLQNYVTNHTHPLISRILFPFWADYEHESVSSESLEPNSFLSHFYSDDSASKKLFSFSSIYTGAYDLAVPVAFSCKMPFFPSPVTSYEIYGFTQEVDAGAPRFDVTKSFALFPFDTSGSCINDVVSFMLPRPLPAGKVMIAGVLLVLHSGAIRGLCSNRFVFTDGPVFQPNK